MECPFGGLYDMRIYSANPHRRLHLSVGTFQKNMITDGRNQTTKPLIRVCHFIAPIKTMQIHASVKPWMIPLQYLLELFSYLLSMASLSEFACWIFRPLVQSKLDVLTSAGLTQEGFSPEVTSMKVHEHFFHLLTWPLRHESFRCHWRLCFNVFLPSYPEMELILRI